MSDKLKFIETSKLPTDIGEFTVHAFTDENESKDHLAICMGDLLTNVPVLSRIHSQCITGESFFSMRCDRRFQLTESLKQMGVSFAKPKIDIKTVRDWKNKIINQLSGGIAQMAKARKVETVEGVATFISDKEIQEVFMFFIVILRICYYANTYNFQFFLPKI